MSITPFLAGQAFDPEAVRMMSKAFDDVCRSLSPRSGSMSEAIAKKIIELAQRGIRDPLVLSERAKRELELG